MNDFDKLLLDEIICIDNFVKEMEDPYITKLWYSICSRSCVRYNIPIITMSKEIFEELYSNYNMFILTLTPLQKVKYNNFYEKYWNKTWKLLIETHNYDIRDNNIEEMLDRLGHNRWWEEALTDFNLSKDKR